MAIRLLYEARPYAVGRLLIAEGKPGVTRPRALSVALAPSGARAAGEVCQGRFHKNPSTIVAHWCGNGSHGAPSLLCGGRRVVVWNDSHDAQSGTITQMPSQNPKIGRRRIGEVGINDCDIGSRNCNFIRRRMLEKYLHRRRHRMRQDNGLTRGAKRVGIG
jgi:hypothetical protein